jgi:hypothetical protein
MLAIFSAGPMTLGQVLNTQGRQVEALVAVDEAMRLDPHSDFLVR